MCLDQEPSVVQASSFAQSLCGPHSGETLQELVNNLFMEHDCLLSRNECHLHCSTYYHRQEDRESACSLDMASLSFATTWVGRFVYVAAAHFVFIPCFQTLSTLLDQLWWEGWCSFSLQYSENCRVSWATCNETFWRIRVSGKLFFFCDCWMTGCCSKKASFSMFYMAQLTCLLKPKHGSTMVKQLKQDAWQVS